MDALRVDEFEDLVTMLMSQDNLERKEAEKRYEFYLSTPAQVCNAHLHIIKSRKDESRSSMSAVLLRRIIEDRKQLFKDFTPEQRDYIKSGLIELFQLDFPFLLRKNITSCLGAVILATKEEQSWNDLVPFLLQCIQSSDDSTKCCCLNLIQQIASCFIDKIVASSGFVGLKTALIYCLSQKNSVKVRIASWEAIGHCITLLESDDVMKFTDVLPVFIQSLDDVIESGDQESLSDMMNTLVDIADNQVEFLEPCLNDLLSRALRLASSTEENSSVTAYSVEFMLVVCEYLPKKVRAIKDFVKAFFNVAMNLVSRVEEDEQWAYQGIDGGDQSDTEDYDIGLEALDRMACALKGKCLAPLATKAITESVKHENWRIRQSALLCVGQIAEGCKTSFLKNLNQIISLVLAHTEDSHPRVRFAAVSSLAQIFTDFADDLQNSYEQIIPTLYRRLEDTTPRIQSLAAASLCNLCDSASTKEVDAFAHDILGKVSTLLTTSPYLFIKEQCVGTIAAVAENGSMHLGKFYAELLPLLTSILDLPHAKENNLLRCRALDAVTLMAVTVGKECFAPDSTRVCNYLRAHMNLSTDDGDQFFRYIMRGWSCMVKILGEDFEPYIDDVLKYIFHTLQESTELECIPVDNDDEDEDLEEEGTQVIQLSIKGQGERKIKLRTSLIEDKILALTLLLLIIEKSGSKVVGYLQDIITLITPLLTFTFTDEVRNLAARISAACIASSAQYNLKSGQTHTETILLFATHFIGKITEALKEEAETGTAIEFLSAIDTILKHCTMNFLDAEVINALKEVMRQVFAEGIKRRQELFASIEQEDEEDIEDIMDEHEDEETLLIEAVDVIGRLLKTQDKFFPIFLNEFLPDFQNLLSDKLGSAEHKIALCVLDDFLEIKPETAVQMFPQILGAMLKFSTAECYEVMQAACFGLGLCVDLLAQNKGLCPPENSIDTVVNTIATQMMQNLTRKREAVEEYYHAVANVASCAVKLHRAFAPLLTNETGLIQSILGVLPIQMDWEEACVVHAYVFRLVRQSAPSVASYEAKIIELFKSLLNSDSLDNETKNALRML
ncbi:hypothetical protein XU18_1963 [Perkinsela sp. CCAP 1560/4]|nr:hypothetical protein XU18_1963 [Perkinsela sp. CCAP 1560/4]|eukprot:KNH07431.1 hypothetical protein XU18_1963 [Perkinsela sp. CCAP 1560/4]